MKSAARWFAVTIAATLLGTMPHAGAQQKSAASRPEIVALDREAAQLRKLAFEALHNAINSEDLAKSARDSAAHATDPLVRASWENGARKQTEHAKEQTEAAARLNAQAAQKMAQARQLEGAPSEPMNSADAAKLRDAINGLWVDQHGKHWEIAGRDSTVSMTAIYATGHRVVYVGTWNLGLIAALHTIKDPADIEDLDDDVSRQLATTWHPAFGVNVAFHRVSGQLDGTWSSQHVTYDGMDHAVKSVQEPWDQPLTLSRSGLKVAQGGRRPQDGP